MEDEKIYSGDSSSWAASLHLVLVYAKSLDAALNIAVTETHDLEGEVLIWRVPHLMDGENHEYLAFGIVKGNGYRSVNLVRPITHGLMSVLPELKGEDSRGWGEFLRGQTFAA